ncbi:hypothetical protein [Rhizobium leguminosarum]|uniref:hypothetical protein n=1 Tax=Rhizobium leguminosarum TaxID=384 RepID=UPI001C9573AA|nr:hypothetical protein [Rhizobium leguminosarum]MBY5462059.1 hypothetical protein [Rhizobium leguminosarum]
MVFLALVNQFCRYPADRIAPRIRCPARVQFLEFVLHHGRLQDGVEAHLLERALDIVAETHLDPAAGSAEHVNRLFGTSTFLSTTFSTTKSLGVDWHPDITITASRTVAIGRTWNHAGHHEGFIPIPEALGAQLPEQR